MSDDTPKEFYIPSFLEKFCNLQKDSLTTSDLVNPVNDTRTVHTPMRLYCNFRNELKYNGGDKKKSCFNIFKNAKLIRVNGKIYVVD
jgi:hypothetical protein